MNNKLVYRFLPTALYEQNITVEAFANAQNLEVTRLFNGAESAFLNAFLLTADETGITRFEALFDIRAAPSEETLDFRRARLINRLSFTIPFTRTWLERWLTARFGATKWYLSITGDDYVVNLDIETDIPLLYAATMDELRQILPANMILINTLAIPYTYAYLNHNYTYEQLTVLTYEDLSQYA